MDYYVLQMRSEWSVFGQFERILIFIQEGVLLTLPNAALQGTVSGDYEGFLEGGVGFLLSFDSLSHVHLVK